MRALPAFSLPFLALALLGSFGGLQNPEAATPSASSSVQDEERSHGALYAAETVLLSLQNWSATGLIGVGSWLPIPEHGPDVETMIRQKLGGRPPVVHVDALRVRLIEGKGEKARHYRVDLDVTIVSEDSPLVGVRMIEDFVRTYDQHNGALDVSLPALRFDTQNSVRTEGLQVELVFDERPFRWSDERPLAEVIKLITDASASTVGLTLTPQSRHTETGDDEFVALRQSGLTPVSCGALLRSLGRGPGALFMTSLSLTATDPQEGHAADEAPTWDLTAMIRR